MCVFLFFLYWFLSFLCFLVGSLFLSVVGFLIRRACSCVCCLSLVGVSLVLFLCVLGFVSVVGGVRICLMYVLLSFVFAFFVFCSLFVFLSVCVVVLLLVGVSGFIGVCVRPLCVCLLRLLCFSLVFLSLSCRFL